MENNETIKQNNKKIFLIKAIIFIAIVFLCIKGIQFLFGPAPIKNNESDAIFCAQNVVKNNLKDPSSAKFNSKEVLEKDNYNRYLIKLDVSATNGFGGVSREIYYVVVKYDLTEKNFKYYTKSAIGTEKESVKILNNWDKSE